MSLIAELKRRNVMRVAALYLVAGWLILQVADVVFPALGVPEWSMGLILGLLILGLPIAVIFSWIYELTPEGIKREHEVDRSQSITSQTGRKINVLIVVLLVLAILAVVIDRLIPETAVETKTVNVSETPQAESDAEQTAEPAQLAASMFLNTAPEQSVAVLPFVNMSGDKENEYFSDGLSEELLNALAKIPDLYVAARTSSFHFKGHTGDISDIARKLRVRNVLEGSVRKAGARVRITAQLIDATNGYHLWSDTYDRQLEDVFAVQDEISRRVAEALKVTLLDERTISAEAAKPTENMDAYLAYLRGQQYVNEGGVDGLQKAVVSFERSVELDPEFALAYAGLALAWAGQADWGNVGYREVAVPIRAAADRALALDPESPLSWTADALAHAYSGPETQRDPRVLESLEKALAIDPENVDILSWYGNALGWFGRPEDAIAPLQTGLTRDPLSAPLYNQLASAQSALGQLDRARQSYLSAAELAPDFPSPPDGIAGIERSTANFDRAVIWQDKVIALDPADTYSRSLVVSDYLELGDIERARAWSQVADTMDPDAPMSRGARAMVDWFSGDKVAALAEAQRFFEDELQGSQGGAEGWMAIITVNSRLASGDAQGALDAILYGVEDTQPPKPGEKTRFLRGFRMISSLAVQRALGEEEAAQRDAEAWLAWAASDVDGLSEGGRVSTRCPVLAFLGRVDEAIAACRRNLEIAANGSFLWWQIAPNYDTVRDTPEWQVFMDEVRSIRTNQLAELRSSGREPVPH